MLANRPLGTTPISEGQTAPASTAGSLQATEQAAYAPVVAPGMVATEQAAYAPVVAPGMVATEQSAYVPAIPYPGPYFRAAGTPAAVTFISPQNTAADIGLPTVNGLGGILILMCANWVSDAMLVATPGWTKIIQCTSGSGEVGGNTSSLGIWVADETAASPTISWTNPSAWKARIAYYAANGAPTSKLISVLHSTGGVGGPMSGTPVATTVDNALAVYLAGQRGSGPISNMSGGFTQDFQAGITASNDLAGGSVAFLTAGTATGAVGNSDTPPSWNMVTLQLNTGTGTLQVPEQAAYAPVVVPGMMATEQAAYAPVVVPGMMATEQSAYVVMTIEDGDMRVTEQSAYVPVFQAIHSRRRSYTLM